MKQSVAYIFLLALIAVLAQFALTPVSIEDDYARHVAKVDGSAREPFRYRVLSEYAVAAIHNVTDSPYSAVVFAVRLAQNVAILALVYLHQRRTIAVALVAAAMLAAFYKSDYSIYTYTELALYLLAALVIQRGRYRWVIPIAAIAALNRESAVLIPALLLADDPRRHWRVALASWFGFAVVFIGLRLAIGPADYAGSRYGEIRPGLLLAWLNATNPRTWLNLFTMYHVLPLALIHWREWPAVQKRQLVLLALPWFGAQFLFASTDETRLFLVPLAVVFVPVVCHLIRYPVGSRDTPRLFPDRLWRSESRRHRLRSDKSASY